MSNKYLVGNTRDLDLPQEWDTEHEAQALEWSIEPPTQEGWYWVYTPHEKYPSGPDIEHVEKRINGQLGVDRGDEFAYEPLEDYGGPLKTYWLGPLPIPEPPK